MGGIILLGFLPIILVLLLLFLREKYFGFDGSEVDMILLPIFACYNILGFAIYIGMLIWGTVLVSDGKLQF